MVPAEEIEKEGLQNVVPKRKGRPGRRRTINYLQSKKNDKGWTVARKPGVRQQKKLLALVISAGVRMVMANHTYKVGDTIYHQSAGGAIGSELTGSVSRPFMIRWDRMYLEKVRKAGIVIKMYERYIDDSNQLAIVPPPGSRYDVDRKKVVTDPTNMMEEENEDDRLARILKDIADTVEDGIVMTEDTPSKNPDGKLPILDMKVWMDDASRVVYQHYEKPMTSRKVLDAQSALSANTKKSVHVQQCVRRIQNTSSRLNWQDTVAPILTDYMQRMKTAGYDENYRMSILKHAMRIHDKMVKEDEDGTRPIHRPHDWQAEARRLDKKRKQHSWSTRGGFVAPIFVPATPGNELAGMMKQVAEDEAIPGLRFKVVETGGRMVKNIVQNSNPTASPGCTDEECLACRDGGGLGGPCRKGNIQYEVMCKLCPEENGSCYVGETSRNLYTRGGEHLKKYEGGNDESFMKKHQDETHPGQPADFRGKVTGTFRDCLTRQVSEGVHIRRCNYNILNSKSEWHQPALWRVRSEVERQFS